MISPKFRFKGYSNSWEPLKLSKVMTPSKLKNKDYSYSRNEVLSVTQEYGLVNQIEYLGRSYAGKDLAGYSVVKKGDIVYTKSPLKTAPYGIIKENTFENGIVSTLYAVYEVNKGFSAGFIDRYFELTDHLNKYLRPLVHKGAKNDMKISSERVLIDQVYLPSLGEQVKISTFFSKLDGYIALLNKRTQLLALRRKAIIQKIFSKTIILKDDSGNCYPEWEPKKLSNFLMESRNKGTKGDQAKKLTVKLWGKGIVEKSKVHEGSENTQYYIRNKGQFIYSKLDFLNCAFAVIPAHLDNFESTIDLPAFDVTGDLDPYFLLETVKRRDFYEKLGALADGGRKAKRVHADTFLSFSIDTPSIDEQRKIVKLVKKLDLQISIEEEKRLNVHNLKKSLLQQMFV